MSLVDKLGSGGDDSLPVHQFWAALCEMASVGLGSSSQQEATRDNLISYFSLVGDDITELDWLIGKYNTSTDKIQFVETIHRIFMLKEMDVPGYTTKTDLQNRINRIP